MGIFHDLVLLETGVVWLICFIPQPSQRRFALQRRWRVLFAFRGSISHAESFMARYVEVATN